jgi:hypothetical protein
MRVSRAALLDRTGPYSSGAMLSGFSHTLSSQIARACTPASFHACNRRVARFHKYFRISSADHLAQCSRCERRLVPGFRLVGRVEISPHFREQ